MKKTSNIIKLAIIGICAVLFWQKCENDKSGDKKPQIIRVEGKKYEVIKHDIDTQYITKETTVYKKGDSIPFEVFIHDTIPQDVDTLALIKDFFSKKVYSDTLKLDDSLGLIVIVDTISQNKILGRTWTAKVTQREIKETTIVKELPKAQLYIGMGLQLNKVDILSGAGVGLVLKTKKDKLYQISTGLTGGPSDFKPYLGVGTYWKIKLKK